MKLPSWREEPIARHHDRGAFDRAAPILNDIWRRYAQQNHERGCWEAVTRAETSKKSHTGAKNRD
ncbi:MAG: hypothetical protein FJX52_11465 [Alphaproteobacteria bacterium]|nr:hypothetical protein [Alphaproteobacteria bacterium]